MYDKGLVIFRNVYVELLHINSFDKKMEIKLKKGSMSQSVFLWKEIKERSITGLQHSYSTWLKSARI